MIPKRIHYCWFGNASMKALENRCVDSWRALCPDYEIIRWDERNAPLRDNDYVREAYCAQKWAFVSDYVRLKALYTVGGIYLDTDVELLKPLNHFLTHDGFLGFEREDRLGTGLMGCVAGQSFFEQALAIYANKHFRMPDGSYDETVNVIMLTNLLAENGLLKDGSMQSVSGLMVYPSDFFSPKDLENGKVHLTGDSCAIHHFRGSWMTPRAKIHRRLAQILGPSRTQKIKKMLGRI